MSVPSSSLQSEFWFVYLQDFLSALALSLNLLTGLVLHVTTSPPLFSFATFFALFSLFLLKRCVKTEHEADFSQ